MKAQIVAATKPMVDGIFTLEQFIAYAARVSNEENQFNVETAPRLLSYLMKHKHWSPFEMANVVMEIECPRDIARQILRHRSFAFQEFSQRYAEVNEDMFTFREARMQDDKNRQNSLPCESIGLYSGWLHNQGKAKDAAVAAYKWAIEQGIAKEQARAVLPEGMTMSRMYMNGTIRSWLHYVELRSGPETQKEHRDIALMCGKELERVVPTLMKSIEGVI